MGFGSKNAIYIVQIYGHKYLLFRVISFGSRHELEVFFI